MGAIFMPRWISVHVQMAGEQAVLFYRKERAAGVV